MSLFEHIDRDNLHHAYLIEGMRDVLVPDVLVYIKNLGVETTNNPDFTHISIDNFKMDEALSLRQMGVEKSFTTARKVFLITANTFSLDSQQALLKLFEEPIQNTHFFMIVPDINALIKTLVSRFYVIKQSGSIINLKHAETFVAMPLHKRIDFIKELLSDEDEDNIAADSPRTKAISFLNSLETVLHNKMASSKNINSLGFFDHIFKTRQYLRQPGSATKTLMESVALAIPVLQ